jgi:hypothetical protein
MATKQQVLAVAGDDRDSARAGGELGVPNPTQRASGERQAWRPTAKPRGGRGHPT